MKVRSGALLIWLACPGVLWGSDFNYTRRGTTSAGFLKLGVGARAVGMGEAYSAVADEASALYWNPAALTRIPGRSVTAMHAADPDETSFNYAAYGHSLGRYGAFGVGFQYLSAGRIIETDDATGQDVGLFTPNDLAASLGYAVKLGEFSLGAAGKYVRSQIIGSAHTGAADIGLLSPAFFGRLRLAVAAANLGGRLKFEQRSSRLPFALRAGSAFKITENWLTSLDVGLPNDNDPYGAVGTEYILAAGEGISLAGRLGFNSRSLNEVTGMAGYSVGVGFGYERLNFDYAFLPVGGIGFSHRASMTLRWGGVSETAAR